MMRYLDILEKYRKDYKISVSDFTDSIMSSHTYYRYLKGETDLKVSQAIELLKKTDIDSEALFSYVSDHLYPDMHDLETFIENYMNGDRFRMQKSYQKLMTHYKLQDDYHYQMPYKQYQKENQKVLFSQAMDYVIKHYEVSVGIREKVLFLNELKHIDPYIMTHKKHIYALMILSIAYTYDLNHLNLDEMMTLSSNPKFYLDYSWDLSFIIFQHLTSKEVMIHHTYEKYVLYTAKKLQGSLDIGFIEHVYFQLFLIHHHLNHQDLMYHYALRSLMTMKFRHDTKTQQQRIILMASKGLDFTILKQYIKEEMEKTLDERNQSI